MSTVNRANPYASQGRPQLQRQNAVRNLPRVQQVEQPQGGQAPQRTSRREVAPQHATDTRKRITDTDDMLARIDRKLEKLGVDNPEKHQSFWKRASGRLATFGKTLAVSLVSLPKMIGTSALSLVKLTCNLPRLFTLPLRLVSSKPDEWMTGKLAGMNKKFDEAKQAVGGFFDGINAKIIRIDGLHGGKGGDGPGDGVDMVSDGAMGIVNTQAGIYGTNVMDSHHFDINQNVNSDHTGPLTTLNDGDQALFRGAAPLVLNTGTVLHQMDDALNRLDEGMSLVEASRQLKRGGNLTDEQQVGRKYVKAQGKEQIDEARTAYARGGASLVQNYVGAVNMVAGSNLYGAKVFGDVATGVTNVTQIAGFGLTAVTSTYDGVMDARAAHSGRKRKDRADNFLQNTARMDGKRKLVESLDTSAVRDGVKLFRKNQNQSFFNKSLSSGRNFAVAAAAITLTVATTAAVAATPVGWAIMGAAAVGAIGFGLYKTYKTVRRQENIQRMGDRLQRVQTEIQKTQNGPQNPQSATRLQELKKLERTIQRYQRQTDPKVAADGLVKVLNQGKTEQAKANAAEALKTVFKIDPTLLRENPPGTPVAGPKANELARKQLEKKLGIFA